MQPSRRQEEEEQRGEDPDGERQGEEDLGAFFRRVPPAAATERLKDLALLLPNETTDDDFVDLGETHVFTPEVMDGECSA